MSPAIGVTEPIVPTVLTRCTESGAYGLVQTVVTLRHLDLPRGVMLWMPPKADTAVSAPADNAERVSGKDLHAMPGFRP
jgi:hypothetical protein